MIYEDELDERVVSMMRTIKFMPGMGLGKDQRGPLRFIERKVPVLKHGVGYQVADNLEEEVEAEAKPAKGKEKVKPEEKSLWETFVGEGEGYL